MTTEEGRIPTMQPQNIQPFITVTIAVSRKFEYNFHFLNSTYILNCAYINETSVAGPILDFTSAVQYMKYFIYQLC